MAQPPKPPASNPYLGFSVWNAPFYVYAAVRILVIFSGRLWK